MHYFSLFRLIVFTSAVIVGSPALAAEAENPADVLDRGIAAYERGDDLLAFDIWLDLAKAGNPRAQLLVALLRFDSLANDFIPPNRTAEEMRAEALPAAEAAADLLLKCAHAGLIACQYEYGLFLINWRTNPNKGVEAAVWLRRSAERGHRDAMRQLARLLSDSGSQPYDIVEALKWGLIFEKWRQPCASGNEGHTETVESILSSATLQQFQAAEKLAKVWYPRIP